MGGGAGQANGKFNFGGAAAFGGGGGGMMGGKSFSFSFVGTGRLLVCQKNVDCFIDWALFFKNSSPSSSVWCWMVLYHQPPPQA
jgi:hypothetical protein